MSPRLGRRIAHFNRRVTNRITGPLAPWLPGFGVVVHVGRKSRARIPHARQCLPTSGDGYVVALTYGARGRLGQERAGRRARALLTRGRRSS